MKKSTIIIFVTVSVIVILFVIAGIVGLMVLNKSNDTQESGNSPTPTPSPTIVNSNLESVITDDYEFYYPKYYPLEHSDPEILIYHYKSSQKNTITNPNVNIKNNYIALIKTQKGINDPDISTQEKCIQYAQNIIAPFTKGISNITIKLEGTPEFPKFEESDLFYICRSKEGMSTGDGKLFENYVIYKDKATGKGYILMISYDEKSSESEIKDLNDAYDKFKMKKTSATSSNLKSFVTDKFEFYYPEYYGVSNSSSGSLLVGYENGQKNTLGRNNNILLFEGKNFDVSSREKCTQFVEQTVPKENITLEGKPEFPKFQDLGPIYTCEFKVRLSTSSGILLSHSVLYQAKSTSIGYLLSINYDEQSSESEVKDLNDAVNKFVVKIGQ